MNPTAAADADFVDSDGLARWRDAARRTVALRAGLFVVAGVLLVAGVAGWYEQNRFARMTAASPVVTAAVTSLDPVKVALPGGAAPLREAPGTLRVGDTVAVLQAPDGSVFYAAESTGLRRAARGAVLLLGAGAVSWLLVARGLAVPGRRRLEAAATAAGLVVGARVEDRRRWWLPPVTVVLVDVDGDLVEVPVLTSGSPFPGEPVHVSGDGRVGTHAGLVGPGWVGVPAGPVRRPDSGPGRRSRR